MRPPSGEIESDTSPTVDQEDGNMASPAVDIINMGFVPQEGETIEPGQEIPRDHPEYTSSEAATENQPGRRSDNQNNTGDGTDRNDDYWDQTTVQHPRRPKPKCCADRPCFSFNKLFRLLTIIIILLGVLACTMTSKATLLLASSQLRPTPSLLCVTSPALNTTSCVSAPMMTSDRRVNDGSLYCLQRNDSGQELPVVQRDVCEAVSNRWVWCLILMMCTPYAQVFLVSLYYLIFKPQEFPYPRTIAFVFAQEMLYCVGVSLFVFRVLPYTYDVIQSLTLMSAVGFLPGLLRILIRPKDQKWWGVTLGLDVLAFLSQVSALILFPVLASTKHDVYDADLVWVVPISLILMSTCWWENYITENTKLYRPLLEWLIEIKQDIKTCRDSLYLVTNFFKIICTIIMALLVYSKDSTVNIFDWNWSSARCGDSVGPLEIASMEWDWLYIWALNSVVGLAGYFFARTAVKVKIQTISYVFPMLCTTLAVSGLMVGMCETWHKDPCVYTPTIPGHMFWQCYPPGGFTQLLTEHQQWMMFLLQLSQMWIARHVFYPSYKKLIRTARIFNLPLYDNIVLSEWLMYNRSRKDEEKIQESGPNVPFVHVCATMWHEESHEMRTLLKSLYRLDKDQAERTHFADCDRYHLQINIYIDDAIQSKREGSSRNNHSRLSEHTIQFVNLVKRISPAYGQQFRSEVPRCYQTPYGGRLVWKMPHGTRMVVHLKDKLKIRAKKRWSQVMYMYELLNIRNPIGRENRRELPDVQNTYLLALDGDVDFKPEAVVRLMDLMIKDKRTAAVCGRIHPLGSGFMKWYQKFEYALGHWMQKSTEHVLGCVLCSPGCFSLFLGSALRDVMPLYTATATEATQFIQYDQGEDRWLNTLLLKKGYNVMYCAASDCWTHVPETLSAFFKQRRRWMVSTMANIFDLLQNCREIIDSPNDVWVPYIMYQGILFALSLIAGGTIFLMIVGALQVALNGAIGEWTSLFVNIIPVVFYGFICFKGSVKLQEMASMVLTMLYALIQALVLVGIIVQISKDGICSPTGSFFFIVTGVFLLAACLHPKEFLCVIYGFIYFLFIPSMYMLLTMFAIINLHDMSWGTRDNSASADSNRGRGITTGNGQTDVTLQMERSCPFTCCSHPDTSEQYETLLGGMQELHNLITTQNSRLTVNEDANEAGAITLSGDDTDGQSDDEDEWNNENCLDGTGPVRCLCQEEESSFEQLIEKYIDPGNHADIQHLQRNRDPEETMKENLFKLRNSIATGYFLVNAIFVAVIFTLQSNVDDVSLPWPCGQDLRLEPIGLIFLLCFGFILLIQTCGMIKHCTSTFLHIVSSTRLTRRTNSERLEQSVLAVRNPVIPIIEDSSA